MVPAIHLGTIGRCTRGELMVSSTAVQRRHRTIPLGLLIVTPIKLYRDGIAHFLSTSKEVRVLGTADESTDTVRLARELVPDVILLDMAMADSRATARAMRAAVPQATIVALAIPESEGHVVSAAEAGISAYVPRDGSLDELLGTILRAADGQAVCSPEIVGSLFRRVAMLASQREPAPAEERPITPLTAREAEVISLIDDGLSNQQILDKLGASSRGEAAARARKVAWTLR
jgi:two-component system, NarL family, nitrate/nitrite response regulator NarL